MIFKKRNNHPELKTAALEYVNAVRAEWMLPPLQKLPKGQKNRSMDCVIARGLRKDSDLVSHGARNGFTVTSMASVVSVNYPTNVQVSRFVETFDSGGIPELVGR
jgi:hypothetical protein